jgi:cell wall-associated NlpC family hydrolase
MRELFLKIAWSYLGKPYVWGGDDPLQGFDCSGFVIECLKSVGVLPRKGDWTAHMLRDHFYHYSGRDPKPGDLVFWQNNNGKIIHVEICLDTRLSIGASGGGSRTRTIEDAIKQNAFIKIRPFNTRKNIKGFADPFQLEWP